MVKCPACAGPDALGGDCATCNGVTEVTTKIRESFLEKTAATDSATQTLTEKIRTLDLNEYEKNILNSCGIVI
jgi:hypothetical protein